MTGADLHRFGSPYGQLVILSFSTLTDLATLLVHDYAFSFELLDSLVTLSHSRTVRRLYTVALSHYTSTFYFSGTDSFIYFSASLVAINLGTFLEQSCSYTDDLCSVSEITILPVPAELPALSGVPSAVFLQVTSHFFYLSTVSLSDTTLHSSLTLFSASVRLHSTSTFTLTIATFSFSTLTYSTSYFYLTVVGSILSGYFLPMESFSVPLSVSGRSTGDIYVSPVRFSSDLRSFPMS